MAKVIAGTVIEDIMGDLYLQDDCGRLYQIPPDVEGVVIGARVAAMMVRPHSVTIGQSGRITRLVDVDPTTVIDAHLIPPFNPTIRAIWEGELEQDRKDFPPTPHAEYYEIEGVQGTLSWYFECRSLRAAKVLANAEFTLAIDSGKDTTLVIRQKKLQLGEEECTSRQCFSMKFTVRLFNK